MDSDSELISYAVYDLDDGSVHFNVFKVQPGAYQPGMTASYLQRLGGTLTEGFADEPKGRLADQPFQVEVTRTVSVMVEVSAGTAEQAIEQVDRADYDLPALEQWPTQDWGYAVYDAEGNELAREG